MTTYSHIVKYGPLLTTVLLTAACANRAPDDAPKPPPVPVVDDSRGDLVLTYDSPDGPKVASRVADVPPEARSQVRVQDPRIKPEARDAAWVFVADLSASPSATGYPVKAVPRAAYDAGRVQNRPATEPAPASTPEPGGKVIMYATKHCPVCVQARRWLLEQGIPYVEKDLEEDAAAAAELAKKGQAQGVSTSGVPVFEVNGKLVPGFDSVVLRRLLGARITA